MVLTRSGASSNKLADWAEAINARPEPATMSKMVKKKQRYSSKENAVEKEVKVRNHVTQKILNEFKKKPKNKQTFTELKQVVQQPQFNIKEDEARKEIVESEQLAEELGSVLQQQPHKILLQPQSSTMDVTISQYDMTVIPELVDLEDKEEYRKVKKIPSWAKNGHQLHLNLFVQQPNFMDLMSTKCFPKTNTTPRLF